MPPNEKAGRCEDMAPGKSRKPLLRPAADKQRPASLAECGALLDGNYSCSDRARLKRPLALKPGMVVLPKVVLTPVLGLV